MNVEEQSSTEDFVLSSGKIKGCRGKMRGHLRGVKLEVMLALQRLATRHGGVAFPSPGWFERESFCSAFWARTCLKELQAEGWISPTDWHGRRAWRVQTHRQWAEANDCALCSLGKLRDDDRNLRNSSTELRESERKLRRDSPKTEANCLEIKPLAAGAATPKAFTEGQNESREGKAKATTAPPAFFSEIYRLRYPHRSMGLSDKHYGQIVELIGTHGATVVEAAFRSYIADEADWLRSHSHPLGTFLKQAEDYIGRAEEVQEEPERKFTFVKFEGTDLPDFVVKQIIAERAEAQKRIDEREREEELGRQNIERILAEGF